VEGKVSNSLAIAAASLTLRSLLLARIPALDSNLGDLEVSLQPPDIARKNVTKAQLNLFLYHVAYNAAWRNMDMPRQVRPGESATPALAINLHYLITAWGRGDSDNDAVSHRVLAGAMSVLHDNALLGADAIRDALDDNDLAEQIERVRITPLALGIEEMSKLWTAFQSNYRVSTAYELAVVLIDSRNAARAALPVLKRGEDDRGVIAAASAAPVLEALALPRSQSAVRLGDDVVLTGQQLSTQDTVARFSSARLDAPIDVVPLAGTAPGTLQVHLADVAEDANANATWAPGVYSLALRTQAAGRPALLSNELLLALAPRITIAPLAHAAGDITLDIQCAPRLREGQRVALLFGDRVLAPDGIVQPANPLAPTELTFTVPDVAAGTWTLRLRVDGVDSIPVDFSGATPAFAADQQVTVT
jgi:Pvc16 N-terminal domain